MTTSWDLTRLSDQEIGYMFHLAKVMEWPDDPASQRLRLEWIEALYGELLIRWACADDAIHKQGERL